MKRAILISLSIFLLAVIMLAVALYVPNTLPANFDFSGLYYADLALVNGVQIYDIPAMELLAFQSSGIPAESFYMPRFLYPPWYVLSTFYLGLLSLESAATLWFELNLVMLFLSIWFLTDGWSGRLRLIAFPLGLFFLPVIGALSVGQFDFPVLLGVSILIYALRRENIALTTLGMILVTFKPHLGALMLLSVLVYLFASRSRPALPKEHRDDVSSTEGFGRRALRSILIAGLTLFGVSFLADPNWLVRYPALLLGLSSSYGQSENASLCKDCANLPVSLSRWLFDGSLSTAAVIALGLLIVLIGLFFLVRASLLKEPDLLLNSALIITFLASPYLFNYDFILFLIPFTCLLSENKKYLQNAVVILCYLVPTFVIAIFGRAGNVTLLVITIIMALLIFLRAKSQVDVPAFTAYNTNN